MNPSTHIRITKLAMAAANSDAPKGFNKTLFLFGSILPDMTWLLITQPHYAPRAIPYVEHKLNKLLQKESPTALDAVRFGMALHYLTDFCCKAHRGGKFEKPLKHVIYESELNKRSRELYGTLARQAYQLRCGDQVCDGELNDYIRARVTAYSQSDSDCEQDIRAAIRLCSGVCSHIFSHFAEQLNEKRASISSLPARIA